MVLNKKAGNINTHPVFETEIDVLAVEWFETNKRIQHKTTKLGTGITLRFLKENPDLREGDILWQDAHTTIVVEIIPCRCIIISPATILAASSVCYEIGNRHLPLYYNENDLMIPYDMPLHNLLQGLGYEVTVGERKLTHVLKTTVLPHLQVNDTDPLFNNIYQLSTST